MPTDSDNALTSIAAYAARQAEHHDVDGLGEARAWRHVAFSAARALGHDVTGPPEAAELFALIYTVRRRLRMHLPAGELVRFIDDELARLNGEAHDGDG